MDDDQDDGVLIMTAARDQQFSCTAQLNEIGTGPNGCRRT
jgi:hypothetical protein